MEYKDRKPNKMSDEEFQELLATINQGIKVTLYGRDHFVKRPMEEDTFLWVVGPAIRTFFKDNGVELQASETSCRPNETVFHFPQDKADIAALFKLTFA